MSQTPLPPRSGLLEAMQAGYRVLDLSQPLHPGIPTSPNHPTFQLAMIRRHGDMVRQDGSSAANDLIVTGGHVGTHVDALGHVSYQGRLYGGASANEAQIGGRLRSHGIDKLAPVVAPGVLLDVPGYHGLESLPGGHGIGPDDLSATAAAAQITIAPGDAVLVRTGWGTRFTDPDAFLGHETGVPGVSEEGARWLADQGVRITGSDTTAYEQILPKRGHALLPVHRLLLVERGINIIEMLNLELLRDADVYRFVFVMAPLKIIGATGSPVRPLAVVDAESSR